MYTYFSYLVYKLHTYVATFVYVRICTYVRSYTGMLMLSTVCAYVSMNGCAIRTCVQITY